MHLDQIPRLDLRPKVTISMIYAIVATGLVGGIAFLCQYVSFLKYFNELFLHREWVPWATNFVFFWGLFLLLQKYLHSSRQTRFQWRGIVPKEFIFYTPANATPEELAVNKQEIEKLIVRIMNSCDVTQLIIPNRITRLLAFWQELPHSERTIHFAEEAAHHDSAMTDEGYTLAKALIWAVPIMGLLGTVFGISESITSFNTVLQAADDMTKIKESIGNVLLGLGIAFDVTLLALTEATIITIMMAFFRGAEDEMLRVAICAAQDEVLCRLPAEHAKGSEHEAPTGEAIKSLLEEVSRSFPKPDDFAHAFSGAVSTFSRQMGDQLSKVQSEFQHFLQEQEVRFAQQNTSIQEHMQQESRQLMESIAQSCQQITHSFQEESGKVVEGISRNWSHMTSDLQESMTKVSRELMEHVTAIEGKSRENLEEISKVFGQHLGEAQDKSAQNIAAMEKLYTEVSRILNEQKADLENISKQTAALTQQSDRMVELMASQKVLETNLAEIQKAVALKESLEAFRQSQDDLRPLIKQLAKPRRILLTENNNEP